MKAYKTNEKNQQVREIVAHYRENPFAWKFWNKDEHLSLIVQRYHCSYAMADKVAWIMQAGSDEAKSLFGFNRYTA